MSPAMHHVLGLHLHSLSSTRSRHPFLAMAETPLNLTLGVTQMGVLISSVLWGVSCVQVYVYATSERKDRLALQLFVALVL
jgi:hypothetical protein